MIAVCLLTCDRTELTEQSARTFVEHNPGREDLVLLHADGGSMSFANVNIARRYGFRTIFAPAERVGQMETLRVFAREVTALKADWVLWLENDWESVSPLPGDDVFAAARDVSVETIRLFGARKMLTNGPRSMAGRHRMGTRDEIEWTEMASVPGWEYGRAHFGGGGCLITAAAFHRCARRNDRLKDFMCLENGLRSLRPRDSNIMCHIGPATTHGFRD